MAVYILKFDRPLGSEKHQAHYYVGYCEEGNLDRRLSRHRAGRGASITRAAVERGITFEVALYIPNAGRDVERKIKDYKNTRGYIETYLRRQAKLQHQQNA